MIVNSEIQSAFDTTFSALETEIESFDNSNFNTVPFEGSWTGGQVVQHIILASAHMPDKLKEEASVADRDPELFVDKIKTIFLNMDTKMKSPKFIEPEDKNYNREELLENVKHIRTAVIAQIGDRELGKICTSFEMPRLGNLSLFELLSFIVFHTKRHTHQLKEIFEAVKLS